MIFILLLFLWLSFNRKSTKRVLELEIQLENTRVASPVSSGAESQSDTKDLAALKIRIKSLERELQQKKLDTEKLENKLTEQGEITTWSFVTRIFPWSSCFITSMS